MKRRTFGLLSGVSALALAAPGASAQTADPSLLKTTLTPMGAERAGNAAGTIPAWTGGMTTLPAGINWDPTAEMVPDFWANESPLYTVNSSNMSQYAGQLTEGVQALIQRTGMTLKVYATHRTASAPDWVYANIAANVTRAKLDPGGGRLGFTGGYGGIPFPIPDVSKPYDAGAQIMWNHLTRWAGTYFTSVGASYVCNSGGLVLAAGGITKSSYPYYDPNGSPETYDGYQNLINSSEFAPATQDGGKIVAHYATDPAKNPNILWELLQGQGRVRKAPELAYDTPSGTADGVANYDEYSSFNGALDCYDWKLIGKAEYIIPYNNNALRRTPAKIAHGPRFLNPDVVRWELHRVWIVDATLHPGRRNVLAHRRVYVDEDTWIAAIVDGWDSGGNLFKQDITFNYVFPNLPGTVLLNNVSYNLQTGDYVSVSGPWGDAPQNTPESFAPLESSLFEPQAMAANASF